MSLSKKIAAALDENTKAYVLPCTVTVEDSPEPPDLAPDGPRHGRPGLLLARVRHDQPHRVVLGGPQGVGRPAVQPGDLPDGAAQGPRDRRRRRRGPDPQPESRPLAPSSAATTRCGSSGREACGWSGSSSTRRLASAGQSPASSRARSSNAWPTTSPPARREAPIPDPDSIRDSSMVLVVKTPGIWNLEFVLEVLRRIGGEIPIPPYEVSDPNGLQVLKCRVSVRRHFRHPSSFQGRGCENGRSTEDPASES